LFVAWCGLHFGGAGGAPLSQVTLFFFQGEKHAEDNVKTSSKSVATLACEIRKAHLANGFLSQRLFLQSDFEAGEVEALLPVIAMLLQFSPEEVCLFLNLFSCVDEKLFQRVSKWF
jgi:hypothetical protein